LQYQSVTIKLFQAGLLRQRIFPTALWLGLLFFCCAPATVFAANNSAELLTFDHLETGFPLEGEHANLACERCHLGGTFETLPVQCNRCHDGVFAPGKKPTHIPTNAPCGVCHTPNGFSFAAQTSFDHSSVTAQTCVNCHNGSLARSKSPNHLLTSNNCAACHLYTAWRPPVYPLDHDETLGSCANLGCHDGAGPGRGKQAGHPLTSNICEGCHRFPQWNVLNAPFNHSGVLEPGCNRSGCHNPIERPVDHPPVTTDRCEQCHTSMGSWIVDPGFDHSLTTQLNCKSARCHNESDKRAGHPVVAPVDCQSCHPTKGQWLPLASPFDHNLALQLFCASSGCHNTTDKRGNHPLTSDKCEACHSSGAWSVITLPFEHSEATITTCITSGCHSLADKVVSHPLTSNACESCHDSGSWAPKTPFDHTQTTDSCTRCHNGIIAIGKGPNHPQASDQCDSCHNTINWLQVAINHSDPLNTVNCARAGCHDGSTAPGKSALHPRTSNLCEACHTYNVWSNLNLPFSHGQTSELCEVCHNGVIATGKNPATHITTNLPCDSCHTVNSWQNALLDHTVVANLACATAGCHDGVAGGPTYKSASHPLSSELCDACHYTTQWVPTRVPIDHSQTTAQCSSCHNGIIATGKSAMHCQTSLECDQCHSTRQWTTIPNAASCSGGGGTSPLPVPGGGGTLSPSGDNLPPMAIISGPTVSNGSCNQAYLFDGSQSYDPEGQVLSFSWRIDPAGTGSIANAAGIQTNITFFSGGTKTITLIVNDLLQDSLPATYSFTVSMMCM